MKTSRVVLVGIGNIGRGCLQILADKGPWLEAHHGIRVEMVAAVDSSGAALNQDGLDPLEILRIKNSKQGIARYERYGQAGLTALQTLSLAEADLLVELSPTSLKHGEPGLSAIAWALEHGMDVVTANKGPLVLAYPRLTGLAASSGRQLLFSGAVAGGLPTVNIGRRDLIAARIQRVEGIFNTTTNYILCRMAESGLSFDEALCEAQQAGVAEADPTLDIDGWDATNKLIIVANSVLGMPATLKDVAVQGIRGITREQLLAATAQGKAIKLLATAEPDGKRYKLAVRPTELSLDHPLAQLTRWQMGVVYTSDINGTIIAVIEEEGTLATAGAVVRDVVNVILSRR
jgi:homoserine dehydrogenase